jgi:hypothetical protein
MSVVDEAVDAARRGDLAALRGFVAVGASSLPVMVRALADVDEPDRERLAASGLADIAAAGEEGLSTLAGRLSTATAVQAVTGAEADRLRALLVVPPPPRGLTAATAARIDRMAGDLLDVTGVYAACTPDGPVWLAVTADGRQVAWIRP